MRGSSEGTGGEEDKGQVHSEQLAETENAIISGLNIRHGSPLEGARNGYVPRTGEIQGHESGR